MDALAAAAHKTISVLSNIIDAKKKVDESLKRCQQKLHTYVQKYYDLEVRWDVNAVLETRDIEMGVLQWLTPSAPNLYFPFVTDNVSQFGGDKPEAEDHGRGGTCQKLRYKQY